MKEILCSSTKRLGILGNKTLAENYAYWADRWSKGNGIAYPNGPTGDWGATEAQPESPENSEQKLRDHLERCGVPSRLAEVLVSGPRETPALAKVREWLNTESSFLVLHGDSGGGKSCAAAGALLEQRRAIRWQGGATVQWDSAGCAFEEADALARLSYFDDEDQRLLDHLGRVRLLIIDDLGAELMNEGWKATLDSLLSERFGRLGCRTILTTNVSAKRPAPEKPSPFQVRYGDRLARRIRESGEVMAVSA